MKNRRIITLVLSLILAFSLVKLLGGNTDDLVQTADTVIGLAEDDFKQLAEESSPADEPPVSETQDEEPAPVSEDGIYSSKDDVALYIHLYGHLPSNFISKKEAKAAGWEGGSLNAYFDGMSIGGDRFGNYEGLLPDAPGREWTECDINTMHAKSRGAERIVFSNDGLIFYTGDHYDSFEQLY